jgi:hypothetical protein
LTLVVVERRQIVEAGGHVGVLRAQGLFPDRSRPLAKGARRRYNDHARVSKGRPG